MTLPFRNIGKTPPIYPANSVVSVFDRVEDAEAAIHKLDAGGFGDEITYAQGDAARELDRDKNQGILAKFYRTLQGVMTDELSVIQRYEQKIDEGAALVLIPLADPADANRVGDILKTHNVTLAHFLGRTSFRSF